jgi:hypothetical protein
MNMFKKLAIALTIAAVLAVGFISTYGVQIVEAGTRAR